MKPAKYSILTVSTWLAFSSTFAFTIPARTARRWPVQSSIRNFSVLMTATDKDDRQGDWIASTNSDFQPNEAAETLDQAAAATGTVNERLQAELAQATDKEKGSRSASSLGKKLGLDSFRSSRKTDEERAAAIAEARDLNGVNPITTLAGAAFALAVAGALWIATQYLATYFVLHPVESNLYFIERAAAVFRNIVMGLFSLASGFFGVTGLGILLLGIRVAYGVAKGELDPTPIQTSKVSEVEVPNIWDLMMNKKPGRGRK